MSRTIRHSIFILLLLTWGVALQAQMQQPEYPVKKASVSVIARSKGDSVWIRWAPDDPLLWQAGNKYGYRVERITVARDEKLLFGNNRITTLVADSVKPYRIVQIEPLIDKDQYAAIVGQAIYGDDFDVSASFEENPSALLQKAQELENRFSFALLSADQSPLAARVHGLWFTDTRVSMNEKYLYRVYPLIAPGVMEFDTAYTVIAVNDTASLPKPYDFHGSFGDKFVELVWNREYLQGFYTSYVVERSDDGGKSYQLTAETPYVQLNRETDIETEYMYRVDSLPMNGREYSFRIRGISPFGEYGPPSDTVTGMGIGKTEFTNPIITGHELLNETAVKIKWEVMEEYAAEIHGFEVSRAERSEGPFISLTPEAIPNSQYSYIDPLPLKSGFYRVAAIDQAGEKHYSFPAMVLLPDSLPPATPGKITGTVDSTGVVVLSWDPNTENDLAGYRIYRSNYANEGFMQINNEQITDPEFYDTLSLRVLTKKVYYKIAAIDKHYNESELSNALIIERPDTIAPAPPSFYNYAVTDSSIVLFWHNSPSVDVTDHRVYRRGMGEKAWTRVNQPGDTTGFLNDLNISARSVYQYIVLAADQSGLESEPGQALEIRSSGNPKAMAVISKLTVQPDRQQNLIRITWETAKGVDIARFALYRSVNNGAPVLYKTVAGTENFATDTGVKPGISYGYTVMPYLQNGSKSMMSDMKMVEF